MSSAIIWGASGGIGRALTQQLVDQGYDVIAIARDAEELDGRVQLALEADVSDAISVRNAVLSAGYETADVSLWVYAAGDITSATVQDMSPEAWQRIVDANLTGAFMTTHHSLPLLAEDAALIYIGAVSERLRLPGLSAYAAAKAGLEAFAEALRKEERRRRIIVVRPAAVDTPLWDKVPLRMPRDAAEPQKVAQRILQAYNEGYSGLLDLT